MFLILFSSFLIPIYSKDPRFICHNYEQQTGYGYKIDLHKYSMTLQVLEFTTRYCNFKKFFKKCVSGLNLYKFLIKIIKKTIYFYRTQIVNIVLGI